MFAFNSFVLDEVSSYLLGNNFRYASTVFRGWEWINLHTLSYCIQWYCWQVCDVGMVIGYAVRNKI